MSWYKKGSLTSELLSRIANSGRFVKRLFSSYIGTGSFGVFEHVDGKVYEVRVELAKIARKRVPPSDGLRESRTVMSQIRSSGIFETSRDDVSLSPMAAFVGTYKGEQYQITVMPYSQSEYADYFIDTKARHQREGK